MPTACLGVDQLSEIYGLEKARAKVRQHMPVLLPVSIDYIARDGENLSEVIGGNSLIDDGLVSELDCVVYVISHS